MLRNLVQIFGPRALLKPLESKINVIDKVSTLQRHIISSFHENSIVSIVRQYHISLPRNKDDKRTLISSAPKKDDGTSGEKALNIDALIQSRRDMFPTEETPDMLFRGIPFKEVPIVNIRVSRNNTIFSLSDGKTGEIKIYRSCGIEGFKNTRKGTNIAAQATAISFTSLVLNRGLKTVRVRVQGLGPGRMGLVGICCSPFKLQHMPPPPSALEVQCLETAPLTATPPDLLTSYQPIALTSSVKGLVMGGLDIISVTDSTRVSENPPRPRKRRRL